MSRLAGLVSILAAIVMLIGGATVWVTVSNQLAEELQTRRNLVMDASFLRASLFTSVVSFGVSALVMGLGVVLGFIGAALLKIAPKKVAVTA